MKKALRFLAVSSKVGRNDVHVIPCADRFFLLLNFHFLQIAHFTLDIADRLCLIDRLDMQIDRDRIVQIQKVGKQTVRKLRR